MEIPLPIICLALASAFGVQGWILRELIDLKIRVATLTTNQENMKKNTSLIPLAVLIVLSFLPLLGGLGCSTLDSALLEPGPPQVEFREVVTPVETVENIPSFVPDAQGVPQAVITTVTNYSLVTNTVPQVVTNYIVSPAVSAGLETAAAVASVTPWGGIATPILGTLSALLAVYANGRNKKYQEAAEALGATIRGVERITAALGDDGKTVKKSIQNEAETSGVQSVLHKFVVAQT